MLPALRAASSRVFARASSPLATRTSTSAPHLRTFASATAKMAANRDPSTLSNYAAWLTKHTTANFTVDFDSQSLKGRVDYDLVSRTAGESREIVLDTSHLDISSISVGGAKAEWAFKDASKALGTPLSIQVPEGAKEGDVVKLSIEMQTTKDCTALQWLTPAQTSNGKHPYMFSQCQAIHARSLFPCQDTPDVKSTYTFNITSPLTVIASGVLSSETLNKDDVTTTYVFEQKVPIPSYLFALASGDIATAQIGSRSKVATGPEELHDAKWELERDIEKFIEVAEKLIFPYKWGEYNVLVLPPSFPYGGMENPVYTFATPTLISGDRQNVDVIAHELAHSWSGNLVTSCSWEHFWLNEGWTIYIERRIGAAIHGEPERDFSAIIGWKALEDSINHYGADHEYTKLIPNLQSGVDPDDAFSTVPYEKGFHFLYYLEKLVGRDAFDKFIPHYFSKYEGKSLDSYEFRDTFMAFFNGLGDAEISKKVAGIDWEARFYDPGMPPKPDFDTTYADQCYALAEKWKDPSFTPSAADIEPLNGSQRLVFLESVQKFDTPLSAERSRLLGATYDLVSSKNVDLKAAYYHVALAAKDETCYKGVAELLGHVGRMKFVRPLFRGLNKVDRKLAVETFEKNREFYHPICRAMAAKDLGVE